MALYTQAPVPATFLATIPDSASTVANSQHSQSPQFATSLMHPSQILNVQPSPHDHSEAYRVSEALGFDVSTPLPDDYKRTTLEEFRALLNDLDDLLDTMKSPLELRLKKKKKNSHRICAAPTTLITTHAVGEANVCGIYHEELFGLGDDAIKLNRCGHTAHKSCFIQYFASSGGPKCPYCRREALRSARSPWSQR
ncbi:hypothetical protein BU23DRAFT_598545 [Bimuria novae-zelandiae CBS 107.79]|uniref:RING-type domain-containing protein n=1 Tax=Bimuria novae-zelandiae CBS 107.79 TaxID=1447943 RepID=A0A6A5VLC3_9PLEO|nr:hypothetical protein BU23DRAFT_598545 [Bimuria novae-zelandiae CBS 107.79]